jgi:hypothetical protein
VRPSRWPQTLKQLVLRMHPHNSTRPTNIVVASAVHACQERCLAPIQWTVRLFIATEPLRSNNGLADWTLRSGNYSMSIIRPARDPSPCGSRIHASDAPPPEESTPGHTAPGTAAKGYRSFTTRIKKLGGSPYPWWSIVRQVLGMCNAGYGILSISIPVGSYHTNRSSFN